MSRAISLEVGNHTLGGLAGSNPAALMGTIFFSGQNLLLDPEKGMFDQKAARRQIRAAEEAAKSCGAAMFLDVVAEHPRAMQRQIEFVAAGCGLPLLVDASELEVRLAGLETAAGLGALKRTVYNSLSRDSPASELKALEAQPPAALVVSALEPMDYGADSAEALARELMGRLSPELRKRCILDVGFLDEVSAGLACHIARDLRKRLGMPVGGAACNGLQMWEGLKARGPGAQDAALAATLGYCAGFGLDFIFFGPLRLAPQAALAQAVSDIYNYYGLLRDAKVERPHAGHPLSRMFG